MMSPRSRRAAVVLSFFLLLSGAPLSAQEPTPEASVELVHQPLWHGPGDALDIRLRITNTGDSPLAGFLVSVAAHARVPTRSDLELVFDGVLGFEASRYTNEELGEAELDPGASATVALTDRIANLPSLAAVGPDEGGVYPLTISLVDASTGAVLDSLSTPLVYYPEPPETALNVVLVVPLNDLARPAPDGSFPADASGSSPLEAAVGESGWLTAMLSSLERWTRPEPPPLVAAPRRARDRRGRRPPKPAPPEPRVRVALAPTPRLLEELADMANGFQRQQGEDRDGVRPSAPAPQAAAEALQNLRTLVRRPGVQPLLVPYSFPDLPYTRSLEQVADEVAEASSVYQTTLSTRVGGRWLYPPAGRLDEPTLDRLRSLGTADRTFFYPEALVSPDLEQASCPTTFGSWLCPVHVNTVRGPTLGYVTDTGIQTRFSALERAGDDAADLQNLFAETAMLREEAPGVTGRVLQATIPSLWRPRPGLFDRLIGGLATAPWLKTWTPVEGLQQATEPRVRRVVEAAAPASGAPNEATLELVDEAEAVVESFGHLIDNPGASTESALFQRLSRNVMVARSRSWWSDPAFGPVAVGYATNSREEAERNLSQVSIAAEDITLTSSQGLIQVLVFNENPYPVTVVVHLDSPKLDLEQTTIEQRVAPASVRKVEVEATTQASGTFPLFIRLETSDGYDVAEASISVSSTEFNEVALGITFGALGFLILFYAFRVMRGRRHSQAGAAGA